MRTAGAGGDPQDQKAVHFNDPFASLNEIDLPNHNVEREMINLR